MNYTNRYLLSFEKVDGKCVAGQYEDEASGRPGLGQEGEQLQLGLHKQVHQLPNKGSQQLHSALLPVFAKIFVHFLELPYFVYKNFGGLRKKLMFFIVSAYFFFFRRWSVFRIWIH